MKLLTTDLHFGVKNQNFLKSQFEYVESGILKTIQKHNIKELDILGDIFDSPEATDSFVLQEVNENFFKPLQRLGVKTKLIVGNHDNYFKDSHTHSILKGINLDEKYFQIIDSVIVEERNGLTYGYVPYVFNELPACDYLFGHFDIKNFKLNKFSISKKGLEAKDFARYKRVFSGHYHISQSFLNIDFLGSPWQMDFGDFGNKKFVYILKDGVVEKIENKTSPRHVFVIYNESNGNQSVVIDDGFEKIDVKRENYKKNIGEDFAKIIVNTYDSSALWEELVQETKNYEGLKNNKVIFEGASQTENVDFQQTRVECQEYFNILDLPDGVEKESVVTKFFNLYDEVEKEEELSFEQVESN